MNITSRQLKAFVLTARHQSFSRAAEQLFITQSGMSVLVRELETQLGVRLFERTTRKVALTEFGSQFLPIADRSLRDLEEAAAKLFGESAALDWLAEMRRVLRPGGRLVLTTHGPHSIAYASAHGLRQPAQIEEIERALYRDGFWFVNEFGATGDFGLRDSEWGTAFFSPEWLLRSTSGAVARGCLPPWPSAGQPGPLRARAR